MQPKEVMTIDELAEYLQVSKSSLYKLSQDGKVPGQKVGKHWRFHRETVDQWLAEGKQIVDRSPNTPSTKRRGGRE